MTSNTSPLTDHDRAVLHYFRVYGEPAESRRAQVILLADESASTKEIAQTIALSPSQVRYWKREWHARGLDIFPPVDEDALAAGTPDETEAETLKVTPDNVEVTIIESRPGIDEPRLPVERRETIGITPDDPMAEAGRKAMRFHFDRMLLNEPGVRQGDVEAVHDMRVATRRMRSAMRVFGDFFQKKALKPHLKGLRKAASALGDVRDLDVIREKTEAYRRDHPGSDFTPLYEHMQGSYDEARAALLAHLDSKGFARFVDDFHTFLTTPGLGAKTFDPDDLTPNHVRHIAPRLIYKRYEQVRVYDHLLPTNDIDTLHALRIDFKRLRYTLEFFVEVLGPEAVSVIDEIKDLQDHLGDLNDARVAGALLRDFISRHKHQFSGVPHFMRPDISAIIAYADARAAEKEHLLATFPDAWRAFNRDERRRDLALAVSVL